MRNHTIWPTGYVSKSVSTHNGGHAHTDTYPNDGVQLLHGDLFGAFDGLQHLLLVLVLQARQQLTDESAQSLSDFCLRNGEDKRIGIG